MCPAPAMTMTVENTIVTAMAMMLFFTAVMGMLQIENKNDFGFITMLIAHTTFCLPYVILSILPRINELGDSLSEAALDLGCTPVQAFFKVKLPNIMPGVISGITMVFVPCVSTFYISQKLGGGKTMLIGDVIEMQFQTSYNYNLGASISLVLMVLIFSGALDYPLLYARMFFMNLFNIITFWI